MLTIFSGVEFQKTEEKFRKRKRKWRCLEFPSSTRREIWRFRTAKNVHNSVIHVQDLLLFLPFSLTSPSSLLKFPTLSRHRESAKKNEQKSFSRSWWVCETFLLRHCSGESRPSDTRGGGWGVGVILTLRKEGASLKKNFPLFGPQFGPKIRGTRPHPLDSHCTGHLGPALNGLCYGCQTSTPPSLPITFLNGRDTRGRRRFAYH